MAEFHIYIHEVPPGLVGNLVGRASEYPLTGSIDFAAPDNSAATDAAKVFMAGRSEVARLFLWDGGDWRFLSEVRS